MSELKFKTNINCGNCLAKVTPFLNNEKSIAGWKVDLDSADKVLTVEGVDANAQTVKETVAKSGFKAEVF